jgi:hypothetical protein
LADVLLQDAPDGTIAKMEAAMHEHNIIKLEDAFNPVSEAS